MTGQLYVVELAIAADEFLRLYSGSASTVVARDRVSGKSVRFPAGRLREFVTKAGVFGSFELRVNSDNRLITIRQLKGAHD